MKGYSLKNAFGLAAAALGVETLIGAGYAVWHHAQGHVETLQAAFSLVAQPESIGLALVLGVAIGAGGEAINRYHKMLDQEDYRRQRPQRPSAAPRNQK